VDTYMRETQLPAYFYDYFIETFMIPSYTCDKDVKAYPGYNDPYNCFCNSGDYHTMPTINIVVQKSKSPFQYDLEPEFYMFRPYLTEEITPSTRCMLGVISQITDVNGSKDTQVTLGQRLIATFPFYTVYDRQNDSAYMQLGSSVSTNEAEKQVFQVIMIIALVTFLFGMLIYLIYLRRARIQAEEWLELNKNTLFSQHSNLKTEEEILEALVKCKEKERIQKEEANAQGSPSQVAGNASSQNASSALLSEP